MARRDVLAFDRSVRSTDADGRLHIAVSHISKATVNEYLGSEIPGAEALGLDPDRIYRLLRDPEELKKGAATFNNLPLLSEHIPVSAADPQKDAVIGSTGTDAAFNDPYLDNSLVVWDAEAIKGVESGDQKEISCAYRYVADMTPGSYQGVRYDGVMREIVGNHVALVREGRAGPDVVAADAKLETRNMAKRITLSRTALLVAGALATYLKPKLAQDAKLELSPLLKGITEKNWKAQRAAVVDAITKAYGSKLAKDASLEDMHDFVDSLDREQMGMPAAEDEDETEEQKREREDRERREKEAKDRTAKDADGIEGVLEFLRAKGLPEEDLEEIKGMLKPAAQDEPPKTPDTPKPPTKEAMDAAIKKAERDAVARMQSIREAERIVRPYVGEIETLPDSPDAVYRLALDAAKIDVTGVPSEAYKAMVKMLPLPNSTPKKDFALDAAAQSDFQKRYGDNAKRLKIVA